MSRTHHYAIDLQWTGNYGSGTSDYRAYGREHIIAAEGKSASIQGSSDPGFRGDRTRYNPEELLVASLSSCHMLWFLHLCSDAGIVVTSYEDRARGEMRENPDGAGEFVRVLLQPRVVITDATRIPEAIRLHGEAHGKCFVARSVNFPVEHQPEVSAA